MSHHPLHHRASFHLATSLVAGLAVAGVLLVTGHALWAPMAGWTTLATVFCLQVWLLIRRMDPDQTREHSQQPDGGRGFVGAVMLLGTVGELVGVGFLLVASSRKDTSGDLLAGLGLAAVAASWFLVHLVFTLRYARLYYGDGDRGIEIGKEEHPDYWDFAYLSFCLGMTYQVSDQETSNKLIRRTITRHTLLSYLLGAVVISCTINLVASLGSAN